MVENTKNTGNTRASFYEGKRSLPKPKSTGKLSNITNRFLRLVPKKAQTLGVANRSRLVKVNSYLRHTIDAAIEGGMRHLKLPRDLDGLAKQTFLKGTGRQLWSLVKSSKDLPQALAARQKQDANLIADILTTISQHG